MGKEVDFAACLGQSSDTAAGTPFPAPGVSPSLCDKTSRSSALGLLSFFFYLRSSQDPRSHLSGLAGTSAFSLSAPLYIHSSRAIFAFVFMLITMPLLCLWDLDVQEELRPAFVRPSGSDNILPARRGMQPQGLMAPSLQTASGSKGFSSFPSCFRAI